MTKLQQKEILKLSNKDKVQLMELLWQDLVSKEPEYVPEWHKIVVTERLALHRSGKTTTRDWQTIRKKYKRA